MVALLAEFSPPEQGDEPRRLPRHRLRLVADARGLSGDHRATIANLSRNGMLIETPNALSVGESIDVELPETGTVAAVVVWTRRTLSGCEFKHPLSQAAVSAALLLSPHTRSPVAPDAIAGLDFDAPRDARRDYDRVTAAALTILASAVLMLLVGLFMGASL